MTPALLLDLERLKSNINRMAIKAETNEVELRPHIKTHKCVEIAKMQLNHGASGITVSTLDEAAIFAEAGFKDITYAVSMTSNKLQSAIEIASRVNLHLLVDSEYMVEKLDTASQEIERPLSLFLKVHCGYQRTGVNPRDPASIKIVDKIVNSKNLEFSGILTHGGHSYDATTIAEIKKIAEQEQQEMVKFAKTLENEKPSLKPKVVSIGSTPTISLTDSISEGITEVRPGNYVFYDYTQVALGSCKLSDCALTVLSRVVGKYDDYLVTDAGATSLSKDLGPTHLEPKGSYGKIFSDYEQHQLERDLHLYSVSQEHGKVRFKDPSLSQIYNVDDSLRILPNHSCLTANLNDCYHVVKDNEIIDNWRIRRDRPITSLC